MFFFHDDFEIVFISFYSEKLLIILILQEICDFIENCNYFF